MLLRRFRINSVMPRVLTGTLHLANKFSFDWGWQGMLAYGCQTNVVIVHPRSVLNIQTLDGHQANVIKVKWARENYPHENRNSPYHLRLASADSGGVIIVWDVVTALQRKDLDFCWLPWQDACKDFLLALHPPYSVVLWNADSGDKLWKKSYTDSLLCMSLDPFSQGSLAFLTQSGNLMLVDDFSVSKVPSSNGQMYKVSSLSSSGSLSNISVSADDKKGQSGTILSGAAKFIRKPLIQVYRAGRGQEESLVVSTNGAEEGSHCLQMGYHPGVRNLILLMYPKEVLFLETRFMQTMAHVVLDRTMSPFLQVIPSSQRDAVYFVQENGCITLRLQKCRSTSTLQGGMVDVYNPLEVVYEGISSSESLRVTKSYRVFGAVMCPKSQNKLALLMSAGRILLYDLALEHELCGTSVPCLSSMILLGRDLRMLPKTRLRFVLSGMLSTLGQTPTVVRAKAVMSTGQSSEESVIRSAESVMKDLVAVGTADGVIQLVRLDSGVIQKEFTVHSCPIKCLDWGGEHSVISCGYAQTLSTSTVVRNELFSTDIRTGLRKAIRPETDESPIEMLRVSYYYSYLAVAFRDQPMEIWDIKSFRLLRRMSRSCPVIVDMAWSGKHHQAKIVKQASGIDDHALDMLQHSADLRPQQTIYRENLVVLDNENHLYHVVVKGMHVRDGKEVNTQWATTSQVNAMVWKDDFLAFGDGEGKISVWDLGSKQSRASTMQRGAVRRLQFSRTPGEYTLIVLHSDGVSLWDAAKFTQLHQILVPKDLACKVLDADLESSVPVLLTADGCLRVFDKSLNLQSAPIPDSVLLQSFSPCLLPPATAAVLKLFLRDQTLRNVYSEKEREDGFVEAISNTELSQSERELLTKQVEALEPEEMSELSRKKPLSEHVANVARLVGDEWETKLWSVLCHVLVDSSESGAKQLDPLFDLLWSNDTFKEVALKRCACFDSRRATSEQLSVQVEALVLLKQLDPAVQLLLDTDSTRQDYYSDCLKACLLSAVHSSSACQSTVKLVATNLIANGKLSEGTQLLCLIEKSVDACRYLQSNGEWEKAAWLAKVSLDETDSQDILRKWADHLCAPNVCLKSFALLLLVRLGHWEKVFELLIGLKQVGSAVLILKCFQGHQIIPDSTKEIVFMEYARELLGAGLTKAAKYYVQFAGERGNNLLKEIEILMSDQIY